jgi:hypothetical protein
VGCCGVEFCRAKFCVEFCRESNFAESNFAESNFGRGGAAGWRIVVGKIVGLIVGSVGNDGIGFAGALVGLTCV